MHECNICRKYIKAKNLNIMFKFTLGNFKYGKFHDVKSYYYHVECLNDTDSKKTKLSNT